MSSSLDDIIVNLRNCSASFRRRNGRHVLRTRDVIYCSFSTPAVVIPEHLSQRSAIKRIAKFAVSQDDFRDATVLDLGSHCGAMLFEFQKLGIAEGLGVEYDQDKVALANDISSVSGIRNLRFVQGDVDALSIKELGRFDIVLALAIESHVNNRERLLDLLGAITDKLLLFEGNAKCDIKEARESLLARGFSDVEYRGMCDDDIRKENNKRPLFVARK